MTRLLAQAAAVVTVGVSATVLVIWIGMALPVSTDGVAVLAGALMVGAGALRRAGESS